MSTPIPQRKPDLTNGDTSWSDLLFNTASNVFEGATQTGLNYLDVLYQQEFAKRLGFQSSARETADVYRTRELAGAYDAPMAQQDNTLVYIAVASLVGVGLLLALRK